MKKGTRIFKQYLATFLVVLMSINTFAAVVGDNDGAAFITKAEFDSMKNDFQSQLDRYNSSIDNKIDGAIAAYLAGIRNVKKIDIRPYISGYENIRWQSDLKVYGKYKKWTSATTYTTQNENIWFVPNGNERRMNSRMTSWMCADNLSLANHQMTLFFSGTTTRFDDGLMVDYTNYNGDTINPPPLALRLKSNISDNFLYHGRDLLYNQGVANFLVHTFPHYIDSLDGSPAAWNLWEIRPKWTDPNNAIEFQEPGTGEIMRYAFYPVQSMTNYHYLSRIQARFAVWPVMFHGFCAADNVDFWTKAKNVWANTKTGVNKDTIPDADFDAYLSKGVTWHLIDDASITDQTENIYWMMLGKNNDQRFNIYKIEENSVSSSELNGPMSTTDFTSATVHLTQVVMCNVYGSDANSTNFPGNAYPIDKYVTIKYPLPLEMNLKELSNGEWPLNGGYLKVGQGLPLLLNSINTGYLQISFDYDVKYILDATKNNKKMRFSIKADDFLTNDAGYKTGYLSLDDPFGSAVQSESEFKDYAFENSAGHVDVTIPVNSEESIWFRMCPQDESGGYYVVMSNLKVTQLTS